MQKLTWVNGFPKVPDFIVQVRSIGAAGISGCTENVAFMHDISGLDFHPIEVGVAGFEAEIMLYHDALAAEFGVACVAYDTVCRGKDEFSHSGSKINAFVECFHAGNRVNPHAELARNGLILGGKTIWNTVM